MKLGASPTVAQRMELRIAVLEDALGRETARVAELKAALRYLIDGVPGNHPRRDKALWVLLGPDEVSSKGK